MNAGAHWLPGSANGVIAQHPGIRVRLSRVGTEVVGGELLPLLIEERGLGCEEYKLDAGARRDTDVVLGANRMTHEEEPVPGRYLNIGRHSCPLH